MSEPEWLDAGKGRSVLLPAFTTKEATWWAQLFVALIAPHVSNPIPEAWEYDGDEALLERVVQALMDTAHNDALYTAEQHLLKQMRDPNGTDRRR